MKDILLIGIVIFIIVALFGDGGLELSPTISPALDLTTQLDVNYAPDRSVTTTTIEQQVNNYIERQVENEITVVVGQSSGIAGGSTVVEGRPGAACMTVPGDIILTQGGNGECRVTNAGQKYFISPAGTRSWLGAETGEPGALVQSIQPQAPHVTADGRLSAQVPLDEITTDQLQAAYTRNGGELPLLFWTWRDASQRDFLASRSQTWK